MMTYVTAFIFYTLAMIGILLIAFVVYKKSFMVNKGENRGTIKILDSLPIGNKKMLLVVQIKDERFLIASGLEHTTFLSKLENSKDTKTTFKEQMNLSEDNDFSLVEKIKKEPQIRFDDTQKTTAQDAQRQFRELYEQEENPYAFNEENQQAQKRKEMLKQLLKDLNSKSGSKF